MAWRIRYQAWIDQIPPGIGPMSGQLSPLGGGVGGSGPSQTLAFFDQVSPMIAGSGTGTALQAADITSLLTSMTTDLSTQMNANLGRLNGFLTGGG